jgi:hypothetical protein
MSATQATASSCPAPTPCIPKKTNCLIFELGGFEGRDLGIGPALGYILPVG